MIRHPVPIQYVDIIKVHVARRALKYLAVFRHTALVMPDDFLDQNGVLAVWTVDVRLLAVLNNDLGVLVNLQVVDDILGKIENHAFPCSCASELAPEVLLLNVCAMGHAIGKFEITPINAHLHIIPFHSSFIIVFPFKK